ncbi:NAD-dependent epimerase/dehydratase family protein [Nocardia bhagyanarayanae]|uniref:NAD-dependent epimerase/dehydratase family protein n=1 Tax=Nocardia bhagyanarayanae TaxID=1215925 RepID=A0A543F7S0_9NOCA|nr:NAD-dependent epimerase/dehydratase family protein [Nocardia bhagyanarayanae]
MVGQQVVGQLAVSVVEHRAEHGFGTATIAVTGASGLVGTALCAFLSTGGHRVLRLVRHPARTPGERRWNPAPGLPRCVDSRVIT